jgi:hypothetical protein
VNICGGRSRPALRSGNGARLCPPDQSQRLRKSGDPEIIPTACKFKRAAAGLCHGPAPDNPKGIASASPRLARQRLPWVCVREMKTTPTASSPTSCARRYFRKTTKSTTRTISAPTARKMRLRLRK